MALFAFLSAHDRRFGAHLGTQTGRSRTALAADRHGHTGGEQQRERTGHASHRGTGLGQMFC